MENPNLALEEIRDLARQLAADRGMNCTLNDHYRKTERLCELIRDLDNWITHFRILPDEWEGRSRKHGIFDYTKSA